MRNGLESKAWIWWFVITENEWESGVRRLPQVAGLNVRDDCSVLR
jgi:hypothetical protein